MALIHCPECQREVSTEARTCPQCAYPDPGGQVKHNGREPSALIPCPDCGGRISKHAKQCPHCGCPLNTGSQVTSKQSFSVFPDLTQTNEITCPHCGLAYESQKVEKSAAQDDHVQGATIFQGDPGHQEDVAAPQYETPSPVLPIMNKKTMYPHVEEHVPVSGMKPLSLEEGLGETRLDWEASGFEFSGGKRKFDIRGPETVPLEALESVNEKWPPKGRERKMNPLWEEMSLDDELPSYSRSPSKWAISLVILVAIVLVFAASVAIWKIVGLEQF